MRIATLILGLSLAPLFLFQSVLLASVGGLFQAQDAEEFGQRGILAVFLWLIGASFVFGLPQLSIGAFALAGVVCIVGGWGDLIIWSVASFVLAGLSYLSIEEKREAEAFRTLVRAAAKALVRSNEQQHVPARVVAAEPSPAPRDIPSRKAGSSLDDRERQQRDADSREALRLLRSQIDADSRPPFFIDDAQASTATGSDGARSPSSSDTRENSADDPDVGKPAAPAPIGQGIQKFWKCAGCGRKVPDSFRQCPDCKYTLSPQNWERLNS